MIDERIDRALAERARASGLDWRNGWLGPGADGQPVAHPEGHAELLGVPSVGAGAPATLTTVLEPLRRRPSHQSEMISELRAGERMSQLLREGDWWLVAGEDGYVGWIHDWVLAPRVADEEWVRLGRYARPLGTLWASDHHASTPLLLGMPLLETNAPVTRRGEWRLVRAPHGPEGWLRSDEIAPVECEDPVRCALDAVRSLQGTPYRWGGRSPLGFDCSGLVQYVITLAGFSLSRDASQQAEQGEDVGADLAAARAGDLVFFGDPADHVGLLDGRDGLLHCRGRVRRDALCEIPQLTARISAIRRWTTLPADRGLSQWTGRVVPDPSSS